MNRRPLLPGAIVAILFLVAAGAVAGQESAPPSSGEVWMALVSPAENELVIGRKPTIRATFLQGVVPETVVIAIDGADVSALARKTSGGFEVTPPLPLPAGVHQVTVVAQDREGRPLSYTAAFQSKHTATFDEIGSSSNISAAYEYTLSKPSVLDNSVADWRVEANLTSSSVLRKGPWKMSLDGVARYKDQDLPIPAPEREGADIISYTFRGGYEKEGKKAEAAVGDVVVNGTPYTLSGLGRKGATLTGDVGVVAFDLFSVRGDSVYGSRGGLSLDGGTDRHIRGGSGTIRLFSNNAILKAVYVNGGESTPSFNIGTTGGGKQGDVLGFQVTTDFFSGKMKTDVEVDFSEFNPDNTATGGSARKDHAIRAGVGGAAGIFTYNAVYEYVGRDYEVIGNQGLAKNRQGATVQGAANFGTQTLGASVSRYSDNVKDEPLLPVNSFWEANLQYGLNRWAKLPISVSYKYGRQESDDVAGTEFRTLDRQSHDVGGQVTYLAGFVTTALSGGYSRTDDRTVADADTESWNARLAPGFNWASLSLTPTAAYSETTNNRVRTDTTTLGLDGRSQLFRARVTAELGGSWADTRASDRSQDNRTLTMNFRLAYNPGSFFAGHFAPSVAFRGVYDRREDKVVPGADRDSWTLFLTLTAEIPVVL